MADLHAFIVSHLDRVLDAYVVRTGDDWPATGEDCRAWTRGVIADLCLALEDAPAEFLLWREHVASADRHGAERRKAGSAAEAIVRDYGALCDSICSVAVDSGVALWPRDVRTMNLFLDGNIAAALEAYANAEPSPAESPDLALVLAVGNAASSARVAFEALRSGAVGINGNTGDLLHRSLERIEHIVADTVSGLLGNVKARQA